LCKSLRRMHDIMWPVPLCKIWVHIWISHPHIAYSLWHFCWVPMKNKGCLLVRPPMLNAKSSKNFRPDQNWANFGGFGGLGVRGFKKLRFLPKKARSCVNPRRLSHFASKSVKRCDLQVGWGKTQKLTDSHRKDVSPLTQGLNYRSVRDTRRVKSTPVVSIFNPPSYTPTYSIYNNTCIERYLLLSICVTGQTFQSRPRSSNIKLLVITAGGVFTWEMPLLSNVKQCQSRKGQEQ